MRAGLLRLPLALAVLALLAIGGVSETARADALLTQGDLDCDGGISTRDNQALLREVLQQNPLSQTQPCTPIGDPINVAGTGERPWGDMDCDGGISTRDNQALLRKVLQQNALSQTEPCPDIGSEIVPGGGELPPTSEELIAAALDAGEVTYEESLRYRALALFADPRLPPEFASPVIDWEAGTELFGEIDENEGTLSPQLLSDLEEFRVRPNDPASIHFDTPPDEEGVILQGINRAWRTSLVPGTDARVWALGPPGAEQTYVNLVSTVWSHFLGVFAYPNPDQPGDPNAVVNPDGAIDFYFVNPGVDPRHAPCNVPNPSPTSCIVASDYGMARRALPFVSNTSSGYLIVNAGPIGADPLADDNLVDTIAHELAHVSQYAYDRNESSWLYESTATWVAYRIMKDMGRTPDYAYDMAERLYDVLDKPLTDETGKNPKYRSWLFFQHAAMVAGDDVVSDVWENARPLGIDGIDAVDAAFNLDQNFDDFTVRNWNEKPPLVEAYKDAPDNTFPGPGRLQPDLDNGSSGFTFIGPADISLNLPVDPLSARYYKFTIGPSVRHVIFENNLVETPHAHVWLLKKISGNWKPPEDMAGSPVQTWCRDSTTFDENLEELIVIVSYSEISGSPLNHHWPRVIGDQFGCTYVEGTINTTVHAANDAHDVTYTSGPVNVRFKPREIQDQPGNVQYDLAAGSGPVHWVGSGTYYGDCTGQGESVVAFPGVPFTGVELNAGYMNVVGPGDFHSIIITAFDPGAVMTVTCPGSSVTTDAFEAVHLMNVLGEPNLDEGAETVYRGNCYYQFAHVTYTFTWDLHHTGSGPSRAEAALPTAPTRCVGFP